MKTKLPFICRCKSCRKVSAYRRTSDPCHKCGRSSLVVLEYDSVQEAYKEPSRELVSSN